MKIKSISHRRNFSIIFASLLLSVSFISNAQEKFPNKPIKLVVPYAPGAITDTAARIIAEHMSTALG